MKTLREIEQDAIIAALKHHSGNRGAAAVSLGIPKRTLSFKIKRMREQGIDVPPPAVPVPPTKVLPASDLCFGGKHSWQTSYPLRGGLTGIQVCVVCGIEGIDVKP